MRVRHFVVSAFAIAFPLASVSGQTPAPEPPNWSLSLGVDPTHLDLNTRDRGVDARMVANLTRSWQSANSRFGRHVSLMVGMDAPRQVNPSTDPECCWQNIKRSYIGLTAGGSYDVLRVSRFTPYLKGGAGVYYTEQEVTPADGALTFSELAAYYPTGFGHKGYSLGMNGGLGIKARFGAREIFIEQMLHAFDVRHFDKGVYPFNIGIRF